jgi:hypothetical protein
VEGDARQQGEVPWPWGGEEAAAL